MFCDSLAILIKYYGNTQFVGGVYSSERIDCAMWMDEQLQIRIHETAIGLNSHQRFSYKLRFVEKKKQVFWKDLMRKLTLKTDTGVDQIHLNCILWFLLDFSITYTLVNACQKLPGKCFHGDKPDGHVTLVSYITLHIGCTVMYNIIGCRSRTEYTVCMECPVHGLKLNQCFRFLGSEKTWPSANDHADALSCST